MLLFVTNKPQLPRGQLDGWLFTNPSEINLKANHDKSGWYAAGQTACYTAWIRNPVLSLFLFASCFWYIYHLSFHKMCNWFMKFRKGTNNQDKKIIFLQACTYLNSAGKVQVILCDTHNWWATKNLHFTNINCKQPLLDITNLS